MHRLIPPPSSSRARQRGITLIESMVALVVAALGVLGIVGVQMRTLADTQTSVRRAQAIRLIEDLSERMRANPNALDVIDSYRTAFADQPAQVDCAAGCTRTQLASHDVAAWKLTLRNTLPLGEASIFYAKGEGAGSNPNRRQLGVMIAWRENERDSSAAYKDDIDATKVRAADGTLTAAGGDISCPANKTCQLQYIPVPGRCAPYFGDTTVQFFCPGS